MFFRSWRTNSFGTPLCSVCLSETLEMHFSEFWHTWDVLLSLSPLLSLTVWQKSRKFMIYEKCLPEYYTNNRASRFHFLWWHRSTSGLTCTKINVHVPRTSSLLRVDLWHTVIISCSDFNNRRDGKIVRRGYVCWVG